MEQEIDQSLLERPITLTKWPSVEPTALPITGMAFHIGLNSVLIIHLAAQRIASSLLAAKAPLLITSHIGRNQAAFAELDALSRILALPIFLTCPSATNLPTSHPFLVGVSCLAPGTHTPLLQSADVVLVIDIEVAWIPMNKDKDGAHERPHEAAQIFVIDSGDPLKRGVGMHHNEADLVCQADAAVALTQIREAVDNQTAFELSERAERVRKMHDAWIAQLRAAESFPISPSSSGRPAPYTSPANSCCPPHSYPREWCLPRRNTHPKRECIQLSSPILTHGAGNPRRGDELWWIFPWVGTRCSVGAVLGGRVDNKGKAGTGYELVASVVGDGTFLFCVPASAFWMARRYLTVSFSARHTTLMAITDCRTALPHCHPQQRGLEITQALYARRSPSWLRLQCHW
jgi:hypothetical protein